ncbi:flagellar filament capping protein FliD [Clostridium sp. ZS1]|uniref:flagellar filament capping protein FliD n=1 Tax=Clostridium sp. ZS1 TaxID=2949989 RepID=UPI00207A4405|nr:flagellar filament capping protein FliD [Clostridium sp. ZS1]
MRITGLATGLDMDEIIKNSMKPYRIKVDQMTQKKDVTEIKQKLYRDILTDTRSLYNKYLDVAKSDSLLLSGSYKSVSFTSTDEDTVTVTSGSGAKPGNYTVTGTKATAAKTVITNNIEDGKSLVVNGKTITLKGANEKEIAKNLNEELKEMNISVRYSQVAGDDKENKAGLILESTVLGEDATFTIGGAVTSLGVATSGKDATAATVTGFSITDIRNNAKVSVNGKEIDLEIVAENTDEDVIKLLNYKLKAENISASVDESGNVIFNSTKPGSASLDPKIEIGGKTGVFTSGDDATAGSLIINKNLGKQTLVIGEKAIKLDLKSGTNEEQQKYLNELFEKNGVKVKTEVTDSGITLTSTSTGIGSNFEVKSTSGGETVESGKDASIIIKDTKNNTEYKHTGNTNTITLDDITFTFIGEIPTEGVKITGKSDVKEIKDKLVGFINDYNTLIENLNTATKTKHDRSYSPLTAEQKKEMSESEIKLWNERVEKGQLYKDLDVTRITNSMKEAMRTVMDGSGLNLEKIGIKPVGDYAGTKNGTFIIDEEKLTKALEENTEDVMKLFVGKPEKSEGLTESQKSSQTGVLQKLSGILDMEVMKSSSSALLKKAGLEGTGSFATNTLTKSISDYEKKIKEMEKDFSRREQALYSKYATLETMMNKLNSQQSSLMSQLGMS